MQRVANITRFTWPSWLNAAGLLLASFFGIAVLSLQVRPGTDVVAVVFPPWWSAQQIFQAAASANAAIVRTTAIPSLLVVRPEGNNGLSRLHEAGAWFSIDPQAVDACFKN
jgi:hypothetical protein